MDEANTIYNELKSFSGPHTDINKISKNLTGHDIYGSYHFDKFTKTNSLRNTLLRFDEFIVPESLLGKTVFDIGCCLGSLTFESARRNCKMATGFEYCIDRVNVCNKLVKYLGLDNIKFIQTNVDEETKNIDAFITKYGVADIVFCCALDAYVDKDRLYSFISKITNDVCFFETNSGIDSEKFINIMKKNGFGQVISIGTSKSDIGYGRKSYLMRKKRDIMVKRIHNSVYDHILSRFFDHVIIENIPFNNTNNESLKLEYKKYEHELVKLYNRISHIKYVSPIKYLPYASIRKYYKNPLTDDKSIETRKQVRDQMIDLVRQMNKVGVAHRDMHVGNFYFEKGNIVMCDFEFLCDNKVSIDSCYDLTGKGLVSPLGSNYTHVLIDKYHDNYLYSINNYLSGENNDLVLKITDF